MNCSNCDAELSVGAETHLLNCAFCGAVQRNPDAAERRPIDDLLDEVFAETGDAAFEMREPPQVAVAISATPAVEAQRPAAGARSSPEVKQALRETQQALNDIFGDEVRAEAVASAPAATAAPAAATAVAPEPSFVLESEPAPMQAAPAAPAALSPPAPFVEPDLPRRTTPPRVTLGGDAGENPEWTRYLVPMLIAALLCGAGVAGLVALVLR